jgi:hypothetical protein
MEILLIFLNLFLKSGGWDVQKVEVHHAGEWKCHLANTDVQELNMTRLDAVNLNKIVVRYF